MKRKKFFRLMAILSMICSMVLTTPAAFSLHTLAAPDISEGETYLPKTPRAVPAIRVYADGNDLASGSYEMHSEDTSEIEIVFTDTMATNEPVTVNLTEGAKLLVNMVSDIEFIADGTRKAITDLNISADRSSMTFVTSTTVRAKSHSIRFKIQAPSTIDGAADFDLFTKVGTGIGSRTSTIKLISGLTIEAPEAVTNLDEFFIEGDVLYQGGSAPQSSFVFIEMVNKETGELVDEIQLASDITAENRYSVGPLSIPASYANGVYLIRAYLVHNDTRFIDMAQKEILFEKKNAMGIEAPDEVTALDAFMIEGDAYYQGAEVPENTVVFLEIINKETEAPIDEIQLISEISENRYSFGPLSIPEHYDEGVYLIRVHLFHNEESFLEMTEKEIRFRKQQ